MAKTRLVGSAEICPSEDGVSEHNSGMHQMGSPHLYFTGPVYRPPSGRPALGGHLCFPPAPIPAEIVHSFQIATSRDCVINGNIGNLAHFSQHC